MYVEGSALSPVSGIHWGVLECILVEQRGTTVQFDLTGPTWNLDWAFQVTLVVRNLPANTGDTRDAGSVPGSGRSPEGGCGNPLQYSCLENPLDRGAWQAMVHRVGHDWTNLAHASTLITMVISSSFRDYGHVVTKVFLFSGPFSCLIMIIK